MFSHWIILGIITLLWGIFLTKKWKFIWIGLTGGFSGCILFMISVYIVNSYMPNEALTHMSSAYFLVSTLEEVGKFLLILTGALLFRSRLRSFQSYIVLGGSVGLGFALAENIHFILHEQSLNELYQQGSPLQYTFIRSILSTGAHVIFSLLPTLGLCFALFGPLYLIDIAKLDMAKVLKRPTIRIGLILCLLIDAIILHWLYNTSIIQDAWIIATGILFIGMVGIYLIINMVFGGYLYGDIHTKIRASNRQNRRQ